MYYPPVGGIGKGRVRALGERVGGGILYNILIPRVGIMIYILYSSLIYTKGLYSPFVHQ